MNLGFWAKLKRPFFCLAPMADVTDSAFRRIITKYGKPDVFWTEFVSADGLCSPGKKKLLPILKFSKKEKPIIAQIFSSKPDKIREASKIIAKLGFDGIDINMGCPDRAVEKQGAGSALIKNPKLAKEIIRACKEGAGKLPVSVKTRIGYNKSELETWIPALLEEDIAVLTVHARTRKELSDLPAKWEFVKRAVEIRDKMKVKTLIIGNGDVKDLDGARKKAKETGCDGVMIGRAIFGNPFLFSDQKEISLEKRLKVLVEHSKLFEKLLPHKNFSVMKKHFKAYVSGFPEAKELRIRLMETENSKQVAKIIVNYLGCKK